MGLSQSDRLIVRELLERTVRAFHPAEGVSFCWASAERFDFRKAATLPGWWFRLLAGGTRRGDAIREYGSAEAAVEAALDAHPGLRPWPPQRIIITAARAGEAILEDMEGVHPAACMDCDAALHADTRTVRAAGDLSGRSGFPVAYLCRDCNPKYRPPAGVPIDHRPGAA